MQLIPIRSLHFTRNSAVQLAPIIDSNPIIMLPGSILVTNIFGVTVPPLPVADSSFKSSLEEPNM